MIGQTLSHYKIVDKIGEGGMSVVYKAEDTRLKRPVALKFLSQATLDEEQKQRFLLEAQAAAGLDHPNICTVHEIDEVDGRAFIVMALVEGKSLKDRLTSGPLSIPEALDVTVQIGQGLHAAHGKGIVHRDIKPANIILGDDGLARIVDFGIALLGGEDRLTRAGTTVGTMAYMSPEQTSATHVDHRTDIWALGSLLYEMISGQTPFRGHYADAIVYAIMNEDPEPLTGLRTGVPVELERIVGKALAKDAADRYQHADDMLVDLRSLRDESETGTRGGTTTRRQMLAPSVAVLPFSNMNRDEESEFFSDGLTEELINALTQIEGLRVVSRTSVFHFKGKTEDIRQVGQKLQVRSVLEGSVRRAGNRVRVTAQLINVADGYHVWSRRFDREMKDVFDIQDEITAAIVDNLKLKLVGESAETPVKRNTADPVAYNHYLKGRFYLNQRESAALEKCIVCFEDAAREDESYASPHAGLAEAYSLQALGGYGGVDPAEALSKAKAAARRAIDLDEGCSEAHTALGVLYFRADWDWARAEQEFRRGIEINSQSATGHHQYAMALAVLGRFDEALSEIRTANRLDPLSPVISSGVGRIFHLARRFDEALEQFRRTRELLPQFAGVYWDQSVAYLRKGMFPEAIASAEKYQELSGDPSRAFQALGAIYAEMGEEEKAREHLAQLVELSKSRYVPSVYLAHVYSRLGDRDKAFEILNQGYAVRDRHLVFVKCSPELEPLREDPRFQPLLDKIGFPD